MTEPPPDISASTHRQLAVAAYNRAWELIDQPQRTDTERHAMLHAAFASRYHWEFIGGDEERAVGDWQIARVAGLAGLPQLALRYAQSAVDIALEHGWSGWRLASAYEGMARAHSVAGDRAERDRYVALAEEELATICDAEDRELIESQLATVP